MALTPGLLLSDRYRLTSRIAVGGMGEVWAAEDTRLARTVAVKILKSELTSDPEFVDRFRSEARITASLNHPGIAQVHDYGEVASIAGGPRDTAYLVMELVTGEPLSAVLARTPRLSVPRTLDVLEQAGEALQVAHARALVHRDIKPGNILITPSGQVKITDFGIAKVAHQVPVTRSGMVMGTAQYLSPEQASGNEAVPASDVYALGVVAYECLAGRRPFGGEHPLAVAMAQVNQEPPPLPPDIPPPVVALVMRMLAKDPAARFPTGAALARAVAQVRAGVAPGRRLVAGPVTGSIIVPGGVPGGLPGQVPGPPIAAPVSAPPPAVVVATGPAPVPSGRRTAAAVVIAVLVLLLTAVAAVLIWQNLDTGGQTTPTSTGASTRATQTREQTVPTSGGPINPAIPRTGTSAATSEPEPNAGAESETTDRSSSAGRQDGDSDSRGGGGGGSAGRTGTRSPRTSSAPPMITIPTPLPGGTTGGPFVRPPANAQWNSVPNLAAR